MTDEAVQTCSDVRGACPLAASGPFFFLDLPSEETAITELPPTKKKPLWCWASFPQTFPPLPSQLQATAYQRASSSASRETRHRFVIQGFFAILLLLALPIVDFQTNPYPTRAVNPFQVQKLCWCGCPGPLPPRNSHHFHHLASDSLIFSSKLLLHCSLIPTMRALASRRHHQRKAFFFSF